ncbi:dTDP-4-dehydrorhamnose 3,5-epimerase [Gaoshiqia sp. Z1-71]|uniref:dTDP-4-dehydrorhamnose 3,5-epimerase n=1 Tax=Gaoshiqia hydrogeniformans TaxID=3290090 RepID=UPI003BF9077E
MNIIETNIADVLILEPRVFEDDRGYFFESFSAKYFQNEADPVVFVQDNESKSGYGVLRGLHFQKGIYAQAKLVRVIEGRVLDVAVDIRNGSATFGQHVAVELSGGNKRQLFIPRGFAHGFVVLSENAVFQYKCDNYYAPQHEGAIAWDDPELNIDWKIDPRDIVLSEKDKKHPRLKNASCLF